MPQWQLAELAVRVGRVLGMPLDRTWDGHGVRLGTEGDGLYLHEPYNQRGRIDVRGWFPPSSHWFSGERANITVRADRGPDVIAAEITRRLLPGYREAARSAREWLAADQAEKQARARLAAHISGLFPDGIASMPAHCQSDGRTEVILHLPGSLGGYVKFYRDGHDVEFERFRVPAAVALRMLETAALLTPHTS